MIEDYVRDPADAPVTGYRNHRERKLTHQVRIDGNDTFRAAANQQTGVLLDEISAVPVVSNEVEILLLQEAVTDAGHHFRVITIGEYRNQDANRHGAAVAQGASKKTRLIV